MVWVWGVSVFFCMVWGGSIFVYFFVVQMAISLLFSDAAVERILGINIFRYKTSWILFGLTLIFMTQLFGRYSWISFYILCAFSISSWLISSLFRKQKAGRLLIDVGRTSQNKFMFWMGCVSVIIAVFQMCLVFNLAVIGAKYSNISLDLELAKLIFTWSFVSFFIAIGSNRLEFRENGFCFMYSFVKWQKVNSYTWGAVNPDVLIIRFKPKFPLLPGLMIVDIPEKHKGMVRYVLDDKLPDKNL